MRTHDSGSCAICRCRCDINLCCDVGCIRRYNLHARPDRIIDSGVFLDRQDHIAFVRRDGQPMRDSHRFNARAANRERGSSFARGAQARDKLNDGGSTIVDEVGRVADARTADDADAA